MVCDILKPPCEIVVWYIIPGIRSVLAKEFFKLGMKQKEISALLDITQPAVSQYLSDKRGNEIEFNEEVLAMIHEFAVEIKEGNVSQLDMIPRMCKICKKIKSEDLMCYLHKEKGGVPKECKDCLTNEEEDRCML